jgi:hypothetical protein
MTENKIELGQDILKKLDGLVCLVPKDGIAGITSHEKTLCDCEVLEIANHFEQKLKDLEARLFDAEKVIGFYADPENSIKRYDDGWSNVDCLIDRDGETIMKYRHPNTDWVGTVKVHGKRAREYFSKWGK